MFRYFEQGDKSWPKGAIIWREIMPRSYDIQVSSFETALLYLQDEWRVYDCDGGGEDTYYVAINDGSETKYFEVNHEFWAVFHPEFYVENSFTHKEITKKEAHIPDDRDWLNISEWNYKLKGWPRKEL